MRAKRTDFKMPLEDIVLSLLEVGISQKCIERAFTQFSAEAIEDTTRWLFNKHQRSHDNIFWAALKTVERAKEEHVPKWNTHS